MNFIQSPFNQLLVFLIIWGVNYLIRWRSEEYVMRSGALGLAVWEAAGVVLGIPGSVSWSYYLFLIGALLAGYGIYIISILLSDKWGDMYNGEGSLIILVPVFLFPAVAVPALIFKLLIFLAG